VNARIFSGTLEGHAGKFVTEEVGLNLQSQIDYLLEGLRMVAQADNMVEAVGIAIDVIDGHAKAQIPGSSH
jgi:hypothetical protein